MQRPTSAPWEVEGGPDFVRVVKIHGIGPNPIEEIARGLTRPNAQRIVACVNACQYLKPSSIPGLLNLLRELAAAAAELRVAAFKPPSAEAVERTKRIARRAGKALERSLDLS